MRRARHTDGVRILRRVLKVLGSVVAGLLALVLALVVWAQFSPRPSVWLINAAFAAGGVGESAGAPPTPSGVTTRTDLRYGPGRDEAFDLHLPAGDGPHPVIVWVHGGGWIGGDKSAPGPYLDQLAGQGWAGMSINYSVAPGKRYPEPVRQLDLAARYLQDHAGELGLDATRVVLAGDSAGAQIAGQYAAMVTSPSYATEVGIATGLAPERLKGVLLHSGPYQPRDAIGGTGVMGWFVRTVGWAYLGAKHLDSPLVDQASVTAHITADFPPALLSGGDLDPLTKQGRGLAAALEGLGVEVSAHWYPGLNHEFQFDLSLPQSMEVLAATHTFLAGLTG